MPGKPIRDGYKICVGVLGATSLVGECLLRLLRQSEVRVAAFSRQMPTPDDEYVEWRQISLETLPKDEEIISNWICTAPIWVLPDYFGLLAASGAERVVALSSTSRFTKADSADPVEQAVSRRLTDGEARLQSWAESRGIEWIIVRPTLIYGLGKDKNVAEIARLIHRWGIFPILGKGEGLRQPVHAEDVARACKEAITSTIAGNRAYHISGAETLTYKEMVKGIFKALEMKPRFVHLPRWGFHLALLGLRFVPRFRHWSLSMVDRMSRDLVFDDTEAEEALGVSPRSFTLGEMDLPECCRKSSPQDSY